MKTVENQLIPNLSKNNIIEVQKDENGNLSVDARKLHQKLKIKTRFNDWIERRVEEYGFEEGLEFYSILSKNKPGRGRMSVEYSLSISMAQELCILDNSEIGKAIRLYLLQMLNNKNNPLSILEGLPFLTVNQRIMYAYRAVQRMLGYSTKGSLSNVRRKYEGQLYIQERVAYITEEYAMLMISRAKARDMGQKTLIAPAVVTNQLALF